jgi:hypothetical protein
MAKRKDQPAAGVDRARSLDSVPVFNEGVSVVEQGGDRVTVIVRLKRGKGVLARFLPDEFERKVKLDELGTFVLRQIDGKATVRDIIDAFVARFRVNRREAELSCAAFIRSLASRHVISVAVK